VTAGSWSPRSFLPSSEATWECDADKCSAVGGLAGGCWVCAVNGGVDALVEVPYVSSVVLIEAWPSLLEPYVRDDGAVVVPVGFIVVTAER
jgi:hypothetical protein